MKRVHTQAIATTILLLVLIAVPRIHAQAPTTSPFHLFSTSDAVDLSTTFTEVEVHAHLSKIRSRRQTAAVRTVSITNFAGAVRAATIRMELEGQTILIDRDLEERIGEGQDRKHFWEGSSASGDELDLLFWRGRLSGQLRTNDKDYTIRPLKDTFTHSSRSSS